MAYVYNLSVCALIGYLIAVAIRTIEALPIIAAASPYAAY